MRARALLLLLLALAGCGDDDAERAVPSLDNYVLPVPRPLDVARGVPLDDARFAIDARDVRYVRDGAVVRVADLRLRDLRLTGERRGAVLPPTRFVVDAPGRPRIAGLLSALVDADPSGTLRFEAGVDVGGSGIDADGFLSDDRWRTAIRLGPLVLADLHPFVDAVPARGTARGTVFLEGSGGALRARTRDLRITGDSSRIAISGLVARSRTGGWTFDDVRLDFDPVHPGDWRAWFGSDAPIDAPLHGLLVADGDGRGGVEVSGALRADAADGSRLAADVQGRFWLEPRPRLDLAVSSRSLQLADRGPLDLDLELSGNADSLAIIGRARLAATPDGGLHPALRDLPAPVVERLRGAALNVDARVTREGAGRRATGAAELVDSIGRSLVLVRGTAPIGADGSIDLEARLDSLPLTVLPIPSRIESFEGWASASARAGGTLSAPSVDARVDLHDVRFAVPEYGTGVDSMSLGVTLQGDRIDLVDTRAYRGGGLLTLTGGVRLVAPLDLRHPERALDGAQIDLLARLDTMTIVDLDSARAVVAGRLHASGALQHPHLAGEIAVVDGFAFEGKLAPDPALDPADPPFSDLLATAPWPATALRHAARVEDASEADDEPLPFTADVTATITPGFRIIDEDSDLGVSGAVRVVIDERGTAANGDAAIVDGFYAYYGEVFRMVGGTFALNDGATQLAMSGVLRDDYRPLGLGQGGGSGFDRRDPPIGIFGYSTPATVLELLRRNSPLPATQPELASLLLFDVPLQPVDAWDHELTWRGDEPADLIGHRSAIQGAGLAWSYAADELYDYVPIDRGYLRAGTLRVGSRYPGWIMLGTQLEAGLNLRRRLTMRATHVVGADAGPGVGLRYALREEATAPADRHLEIFNEPRFAASLGTAGRREDVDVRRRTGVRARWRWDW